MLNIKDCLNKQLVSLCKRSMQLEDLQDKIAKNLPKELVSGFQVGNFEKGCLTLTTRDAAWASQLRYLVFELRDTLRKNAGLYQLTSIKISLIEPKKHYKKTIPKTRHALSSRAKASLIEESQQCTYPPLKEALLNLAERSPKKFEG